MSANVETMFYVNEVPWHGLGVRVKEAPTSDEALKIACLDWNVIQRNVYVDGKIAKGYKANVRDSDGKLLGIVSDRYSIVQNKEAFEFTDAIVGNGEIEVRYETAGSLANGTKVWLLAKMPDVKVLGDKVEPYLVFTNSHNGLASIRVALTPIRVVCQNTLTMALNGAERTWSTKHLGDMQSKVLEAQLTLHLAQMYVNGMEEVADLMSQRIVNTEVMKEFLDTVFPYPIIDSTTNTKKIENVSEIRKEFLRIYNNKDDITRFKNTGWGVYNAMSDLVTHAVPKRKTSSFQENKFMDLVDGNKLLAQTQKFLLSA